jgi:hypothetical protein
LSRRREEKQKVVVSREPRRPPDRSRGAAAKLLMVPGVTFLIVGLVDLVLLWIPAQMDSVAWEFATVGRTLDGLPMPVLGLALLAYGASRHPRYGHRALRGFAGVFSLFALALIVLGVLFATLTPAVLSQTPREALEGVQRAVVRHAVQAVAYPMAFVMLALALWRSRSS